MRPTVLFVAEHKTTGKKYLGKTTRPDSLGKTYFGSGLHWKEHLKVHGRVVKILSRSKVFLDEKELEEFALFLSNELDVVNSDEYLNLKEENGLDGGGEGSPVASKTFSIPTKKCSHCGGIFPPQVYGRLHGDYCNQNPERKEKSKIKCEVCGEKKLPHIYHRDHGEKCGKKRKYRPDSRPAVSCLSCKTIIKGLMNLNQHRGSKVCRRNQERMSLSN